MNNAMTTKQKAAQIINFLAGQNVALPDAREILDEACRMASLGGDRAAISASVMWQMLLYKVDGDEKVAELVGEINALLENSDVPYIHPSQMV